MKRTATVVKLSVERMHLRSRPGGSSKIVNDLLKRCNWHARGQALNIARRKRSANTFIFHWTGYENIWMFTTCQKIALGNTLRGLLGHKDRY